MRVGCYYVFKWALANVVHAHSKFISFSKEIAIFCSFLLGLGDSCFNTQLLSILGLLYAEDSAPAFAVFKFVQVASSSDRGSLPFFSALTLFS